MGTLCRNGYFFVQQNNDIRPDAGLAYNRPITVTRNPMDINAYMQNLGEAARNASRAVARASTNSKNAALRSVLNALQSGRDAILAANARDMENSREFGLESALLDRLELTPGRFDGMLEGLRQVIALTDPVGEITDLSYRPTGIQVGKMRVPLGVIGIIYESRPNVTLEAAALCLKSGNACILRGGSEAIHSNKAIARRHPDRPGGRRLPPITDCP